MSGRDNATRYAKQWVVYFDDDLKDTAKAVADKKGNVTVSLTRYGGGEDSLPSTAFAGVVANSRLVILAMATRNPPVSATRTSLPKRWPNVSESGWARTRSSASACTCVLGEETAGELKGPMRPTSKCTRAIPSPTSSRVIVAN